MEKELELQKMNSKISLTTDKLSKEQAYTLGVCLNKLSMLKNVELKKEAFSLWEEAIMEDIANYMFSFDDFIGGINLMIRKPIYNRIDYADVYNESRTISYKRRIKEVIECPFCKKKFLPLHDIIRNINKVCECGKRTSDMLTEVLLKDENLAVWDMYKEWGDNGK